MSESDVSVTQGLLLDRVRASDSPESIIIGLKGSKNGLLTLASAFVQLWKESKDPRCTACALDIPVDAPAIQPSNSLDKSQDTNRRSPCSSSESKSESAKVCRDAWKGRACSSQSGCSRIHPQLCFDPTCKGKESCSRFHGRRKHRRSSRDQEPNGRIPKRTQRRPQPHYSQDSPNLLPGNGFTGKRHPNPKAFSPMLSHFTNHDAEEHYLRFRLAELMGSRPRSYRDVAAAPPALIQPRDPHSPPMRFQSPPKQQLGPLPAAPASGLPTLSDAILQAVSAALARAGLSL